MVVRLVCGNCGRIKRFDSWDDADMAGWDTPLVYGYTACEQCPGVAVYFPILLCQQARETADPALRAELLEKAAEATVEHHPRFLPDHETPARGVWMPS